MDRRPGWTTVGGSEAYRWERTSAVCLDPFELPALVWDDLEGWFLKDWPWVYYRTEAEALRALDKAVGA